MTRPINILVLIDLVQDLDVLSPIILRLSEDTAFNLKIVVSKWLLAESPRVAAVLNAAKAPFKIVRRNVIIEGSTPLLSGVDALLTASESDHAAHTAGWALTTRANAAGIATYTVQHGLRMQGLGGSLPARFASKTLFCWFAEHSQPADLSAETRGKLAFVGRATNPAALQVEMEFDLAIFENLHDEVYSQADRDAFMETLFSFLDLCGGLRVCIRTHPAGGWLDPFSEALDGAGVVFIASAEARTSPSGAAELIAGSRSVITTPSTVALDAAQAARPVGLALEGGADFESLPVLADAYAWLGFAQTARYGAAEDTFLSRHVAPGDAWVQIRTSLIADARGASITSPDRGRPLHFRSQAAKSLP